MFSCKNALAYERFIAKPAECKETFGPYKFLHGTKSCTSEVRLKVSPTNIAPLWKSFLGTNALAYKGNFFVALPVVC